MNVFFELIDYAVKRYGHKYLALYDADNWQRHQRYWDALLLSERVWAEDNGGVKFIKNRRTQQINTPVDMKEFFWIKLKSHTL